MAKRVLLCINAHARRGEVARDEAAAALREHGHTVVTIDLHAPGDLDRAIREHAGDVDLVAVGGGDGTLLGAIAALRDTKLPLLVLPLGTINELARTLGISKNLAAAAKLVDDGTAHAIDVANVNGTWYFDEASIGLSTRVARLQTGPVKRRLGMLAIPIATLRALRYLRPFHVDVRVNGGDARRFHTVQVTVANSHRFGGVVENPDASMDDGALEFYSLDVRGWKAALQVVGAVLLRRFTSADCVVALKGTTFTVHTHRPRAIYADGEPAGHTPAEFTVAREAVTVIGEAHAMAALS